VFNFPEGIHSWAHSGEQLQQMKPDIQRVIGRHARSARVSWWLAHAAMPAGMRRCFE
jgi:hypothetical protein